MNNNYPIAPKNYSDQAEYIRKIVTTVNNCVFGKTNNTGEIILDNDTSTVVEDNRVNENSVILMMPINSTASGEGYYITAGDRQFTITHDSSGLDRAFRYVVIG